MKKNNKKKIISFFTILTLVFSYMAMLYSGVEVYAIETNTYKISATNSGSSKNTSKPKSGSYKSNKSGSYSTKPNTTTIKPDSGSFSTKPDSSINKEITKPNTTIKPDSGSFSTTKPQKDNNTNENGSSGGKGGSYNNNGGNKSSRPIFSSGRYYGYSNPFYGMMYGFRTSSWITKLVIIITIIIVAYMIIDFIRSRRD